MQAARYALQRFASRAPSQLGKQIRKMSGGAVSHEEEVKQMGFWKNVTFAGKRNARQQPA